MKAPNRSWAALFGVALLLACAFGALQARAPWPPAGQGGTATVRATPTATLPPGWWAYRDASGDGMQGGPSGSVAFQEVGTIFVPPGADPNHMAQGLGIGVTFKIITSATGTFKHDVLCGIYRDANTTLAGYPAQWFEDLRSHSWSLATSATWYQVDYSLPGDKSGQLLIVTPTPVPAATRTAAKEQARAILATFRPIPATPPKC